MIDQKKEKQIALQFIRDMEDKEKTMDDFRREFEMDSVCGKKNHKKKCQVRGCNKYFISTNDHHRRCGACNEKHLAIMTLAFEQDPAVTKELAREV